MTSKTRLVDALTQSGTNLVKAEKIIKETLFRKVGKLFSMKKESLSKKMLPKTTKVKSK